MNFSKLFDITVNLPGMYDMGVLPTGHRFFVETSDGVFKGPEIEGVVRPLMGGEWATLTDSGYVILDVRLTLQTNDDAYIYVEYTGRFEQNEKAQKGLAGEISTDYGDHYFFTNPRMQTSAEKYKYLNDVFCVARGKISPGQVHYEYYKVEN
jgi:hypothetical protein